RPGGVCSMTFLIWAIVTLLVLGALVFVYVTASVNAEAGRQDDVVSVPAIATDGVEFMRTLASVAGHPAQESNSVELYQNGAEIFPPMLDAIAKARDSVHFSTYVFEPGRVPEAFASAFADAAKRGAEVRIILDRHGSKKIPAPLVQQMKHAACDVRWFRRAQWYDWEKYNRRTHRRLLVIDGEVGFTGGVGIADQWDGNGDGPSHWRYCHVRVRGPAVTSLQSTFVDNWNEATGELVLGARDFAEPESGGHTRVCIMQSTRANASAAAQLSFDPRSFALNAECAAVMLEDDIAQAATRAFSADLANSRRVMPGDLEALSIFSRAIDAGAYWVRSQL